MRSGFHCGAGAVAGWAQTPSLSSRSFPRSGPRDAVTRAKLPEEVTLEKRRGSPWRAPSSSLTRSTPGLPVAVTGPGSHEAKKEVPAEPSHPRTLSLWGWGGHTALRARVQHVSPPSLRPGMTPEQTARSSVLDVVAALQGLTTGMKGDK